MLIYKYLIVRIYLPVETPSHWFLQSKILIADLGNCSPNCVPARIPGDSCFSLRQTLLFSCLRKQPAVQEHRGFLSTLGCPRDIASKCKANKLQSFKHSSFMSLHTYFSSGMTTLSKHVQSAGHYCKTNSDREIRPEGLFCGNVQYIITLHYVGKEEVAECYGLVRLTALKECVKMLLQ